MEHDLTDNAMLVALPEGVSFDVGDRVKRRRFDGTVDTFIVVPHSGACSGCDFPYKDNQYPWEICIPNSGYNEKMCYKHARGEVRIMFKSIDKLLEEI